MALSGIQPIYDWYMMTEWDHTDAEMSPCQSAVQPAVTGWYNVPYEYVVSELLLIAVTVIIAYKHISKTYIALYVWEFCSTHVIVTGLVRIISEV